MVGPQDINRSSISYCCFLFCTGLYYKHTVSIIVHPIVHPIIHPIKLLIHVCSRSGNPKILNPSSEHSALSNGQGSEKARNAQTQSSARARFSSSKGSGIRLPNFIQSRCRLAHHTESEAFATRYRLSANLASCRWRAQMPSNENGHVLPYLI